MDTSFDPTPDASQAPAELHVVPVDPTTMTALENSKPVETGLVGWKVAGGDLFLYKTPIRLNLEIDLSPQVVTPGYAPRDIDRLTLNTTPQRVALKLLTASLVAHQAELNDGTRVVRPQHAIQWLLDRVAIGLPSEVLDRLMQNVD
jgi:hypothetical protein